MKCDTKKCDTLYGQAIRGNEKCDTHTDNCTDRLSGGTGTEVEGTKVNGRQLAPGFPLLMSCHSVKLSGVSVLK